MKYFKWLTNNFGLKLISLVLALATWIYVTNEIEKFGSEDSKRVEVVPSYGKMLSRKVFVKAIFVGTPPAGYELIAGDVKIDPEYFILAGPVALFRKIDKLETEPIDVSNLKKTILYDARIAPIDPSYDTQWLSVKVGVPIRKIASNNSTNEKKQ